jgi:WD40 repeat protein
LSFATDPLALRADFYVVGGTLGRDAPSYVARRADDELFELLASGELCYVLTARQMGKSSLMVRTAARLRAAGDAPAVLDLTEIGRNVTIEQWYKGLLVSLGEQLGIEDELDDAWRASRDAGPIQRFLRALRDVVVPRIPGRVVVFVDEIDAVLSLPFSTDEFFAGIRELYNRRAEEPELERLTFCLLGVASPGDLIRDVRTTPFNIGRRIELDDFTRDEIAPLAAGLTRDARLGEMLLDRVFLWTGGHPYLTQRLCRAIAAEHGEPSEAGVDVLCDDLFLSRGARERDDNLVFVRDRMLRSDVDLPELLELYRTVRSGARVPADEASPLVGVLKLAGIVRVRKGALAIRNRIYDRVFNDEWIRANTPGAEMRRQRRAFTRGFLRAAAGAGLVLLAMIFLVVDAIRSRDRAEESRAIAEQQQAIAEREQANNAQLLYVAHVNLAYQAFARGDYARTLELLDEERPAEGREPHGFEYLHLWSLMHGDLATIATDAPVLGLALSPDGTRVAEVGTERYLKVRDAATGEARLTTTEGAPGIAVAWSPDGTRIATASEEPNAKLYLAGDGRLVATFPLAGERASTLAFAHASDTLVVGTESGSIFLFEGAQSEGRRISANAGRLVAGIAVSPDDRTIAVGYVDGTVALVPLAGGEPRELRRAHTQFVRGFAFSGDGRSLVTAGADGRVLLGETGRDRDPTPILATGIGAVSAALLPGGARVAIGRKSGLVEIVDLASKKIVASLTGHADSVLALAPMPDGVRLWSGGGDRRIKLWDLASATSRQDLLVGHDGPVYSVAFSRDNRTVATASFDGTVGLWDVASGSRIGTLRGGEKFLRSVAWTPDGTRVVAGGDDAVVRVWEVASGRLLATLGTFDARVVSIAISPDGSRVAAGSFDGTIRVWDLASYDLVARIADVGGAVECVAYSPDGRYLAAGGESRTVELWDAASLERVGSLVGHADWTNAIAFSPDGARLASVGSYGDATVRVWDVERRETLFELRGFGNSGIATTPLLISGTGRSNAICYSPDGRNIAVGTVDSALKLFDARTGQELTTISPDHGSQIYTVAFSTDGSTLATGSEDATVRLRRAVSIEAVERSYAAADAHPAPPPMVPN